MPLDLVRELEQEHAFGHLYPWLLTTTGVGTTLADGRRIGEEMAQWVKDAGVTGCILVAT